MGCRSSSRRQLRASFFLDRSVFGVAAVGSVGLASDYPLVGLSVATPVAERLLVIDFLAVTLLYSSFSGGFPPSFISSSPLLLGFGCGVVLLVVCVG